MSVPGIGPLIATAIAVLASPSEMFRKAYDFAAWPGLEPVSIRPAASNEWERRPEWADSPCDAC